MIPWIRLTLPLSAILLQACVSTPDEVATTSDVGASTGSTSGGPGPSTTPGTTMPGEDTMGTQGGTGMETTMGAVDTTAGSSSTSAGETTMGVDPSTGGSSSGGESSSTGEPPPPPECIVPGDCAHNETCTAGDCVPACNPWGDGHYDYCLTPIGGFNSAVLCGEPMTCINSTNMSGQVEVVVCGRTCAALCDCPEPPPTGDAIVTCGEVVVGGSNECYLSCANGEMCPDGMVCRNGNAGTPLYCAHPVQPLQMYGNCGGVAAPCVDSFCQEENGYSICLDTCANVGECATAPDGAANASACGGVIFPPMGNECYLPCTMGGDCPTGMSCYTSENGGQLCMWP